MDISERMGVLPRIVAHATGTTVLDCPPSVGAQAGPDRLPQARVGAMSDRHVEIMRDDLSEIYYDASRDDVEYLFGDEITSISDDGDVTFEQPRHARFDVVVGADGLHSGVRRLVFGDEVAERVSRRLSRGGIRAEIALPAMVKSTGYLGPTDSR